MGRFSPTVVAQPGPDWAGALSTALRSYILLKDKREERKEVQQDRAEVRADRAANRDREHAKDVLAGIVPGRMPSDAGGLPGGFVAQQPPRAQTGAMDDNNGTNFSGSPVPGASARVGPSLEDAAPGASAPAPAATPPTPAPPKPAAPGAFSPAAGGFTPVQRVQLTDDLYYDPTIPNAVAAQKKKSELDDYLAKLQLKNQYDPPAWAPHSREEYVQTHGTPAWHPSSMGETVDLHDAEAEGSAAASARHRASGDPKQLTPAQKEQTANELATRAVRAAGGDPRVAQDIIAASPEDMVTARAVGLNRSHYYAAAQKLRTMTSGGVQPETDAAKEHAGITKDNPGGGVAPTDDSNQQPRTRGTESTRMARALSRNQQSAPASSAMSAVTGRSATAPAAQPALFNAEAEQYKAARDRIIATVKDPGERQARLSQAASIYNSRVRAVAGSK